jgi:glutamine cyclotransferase
LNGRSTVRKVDLATGKVLQVQSLPQEYFGEGLTEWKGKLVQLTWRSQVGFLYDRRSLSPTGRFAYHGEGWGLTHDNTSLIMSDGTSILRFLDPNSFKEIKTLEVTDSGVPVSSLNELEYIKGRIFANIWRKDYIAIIRPESGKVVGWIDLTGLRSLLVQTAPLDVLNGIAYDAAKDRIYVTGKLWPRLFEIEIVPKEAKDPG